MCRWISRKHWIAKIILIVHDKPAQVQLLATFFFTMENFFFTVKTGIKQKE
jgi:hypothetical protein